MTFWLKLHFSIALRCAFLSLCSAGCFPGVSFAIDESQKGSPDPDLVGMAATNFLLGRDAVVEKLATQLVEKGDSNGYLLWGLLFGSKEYDHYDTGVSAWHLERGVIERNADAITALLISVLDEPKFSEYLTIDVNEHINTVLADESLSLERAALVTLYCLTLSRDCGVSSKRLNRVLNSTRFPKVFDPYLIGLVGVVRYYSQDSDILNRQSGYGLIESAAKMGEPASQARFAEILEARGRSVESYFWYVLASRQLDEGIDQDALSRAKEYYGNEYSKVGEKADAWLAGKSRVPESYFSLVAGICHELHDPNEYASCIRNAQSHDSQCSYRSISIIDPELELRSARYARCREKLLDYKE